MVKTSRSGEEIREISIEYLTRKKFYLNTNSQNQLVFTDGKEINNTVLILLFLLFFLVGGLLYYLLSKTHTISVNLVETFNGLIVNIDGNTELSRSIAEEFLEILETFDTGSYPVGYVVREMKCPKCGSSLDYNGKSKFVKCTFCGSSLSINELRK